MAETVVLDTNVFLNVINKEEPFFASSSRLLDLIDEGELNAVVSTVTLAELSTGYYMTGDEKGWKEFLIHLVSSENYIIVDLDVAIANKAGKLRAETGLKLPDSIIIASGLKEKAEFLVTQDMEFSKASSVLRSLTSMEFMESEH
ncbi:MAG: PIN domain-containing protein [Candidatus Bathyarchaeota archaeon]|nr:PIN domain-containing protein [Candidatus Bathyarchaeota archaeon]